MVFSQVPPQQLSARVQTEEPAVCVCVCVSPMFALLHVCVVVELAPAHKICNGNEFKIKHYSLTYFSNTPESGLHAAFILYVLTTLI